IKLTESVKSFHVPETPSTRACPPRIPSEPTSRATRVTSEAKERNWSTIVLTVSFNSRNSPDIDCDFLGQIAIRHRRRHSCDVTDLRRKIAGHQVDVFCQIFPGAGDPFD